MQVSHKSFLGLMAVSVSSKKIITTLANGVAFLFTVQIPLQVVFLKGSNPSPAITVFVEEAASPSTGPFASAVASIPELSPVLSAALQDLQSRNLVQDSMNSIIIPLECSLLPTC